MHNGKMDIFMESIERLNNLVTFGNKKDKMARKLEKFDTRQKKTL